MELRWLSPIAGKGECHRKQSLLVATLSALLLFPGCGSGESSTPDGDPRTTKAAQQSSASASSSAIGSETVTWVPPREESPDPDRLLQILKAIAENTPADGETVEIRDCPLGSGQALWAGVPTNEVDSNEPYFTVSNYGDITAGFGPELSCVGYGEVVATPLNYPLPDDKVQAGVATFWDDAKWSEWKPYFAGSASSYCRMLEGTSVCGAVWHNDSIVIHGELAGTDSAQAAADWFARLLPGVLGSAGSAGGISVSLVRDIHWKDGYTGTLSFQGSLPGGFYGSVKASPPGKAKLAVEISVSGHYADTTPARDNGPIFDEGIGIAALYPSNSPVCSLKHEDPSDGLTLLARPTEVNQMMYCVIDIQVTDPLGDGEYANSGERILSRNMQEAALVATLDALNAPDALIAYTTIPQMGFKHADPCHFELFDGGGSLVGKYGYLIGGIKDLGCSLDMQ